jgi:hypothetical protein
MSAAGTEQIPPFGRNDKLLEGAAVWFAVAFGLPWLLGLI